ncbi:MAG: hypothetical protein QXL94_05935 [Candidatus Parvarchaeum sp.]
MRSANNAHAARFFVSLIAIILLIIGLIVFFAGILIFIGVDLLSDFLPKYVISNLLPQDLNFIDGFLIAAGISTIIASRLFHTSGKWLKQNERKGAILAILLSISSIIVLVSSVIYLNLTLLGYTLDIFLLIFIAIIISVLLNWADMNGNIEDVLPGVGYFVAAGFVIFLIFIILYAFFPLQLSSISSVGSSSFLSVFTGNFGIRTVHSEALNYSYPASVVNINLTGLITAANADISLENNTLNQTNTSKLLENTSLNLLIPNSFILSAIGNSPEFLTNLKSINVNYYLEQKNASLARRYLESELPPLSGLYVILTGYQKLNTIHNVSLLSLSPSKFDSYLKKLNVRGVNSSFPINLTDYINSNKTYDNEFNGYIPSQLLLVNMSNHVGIDVIYNQSRIFNLTRIPFYSASISLYQSNDTLCFDIGVDFAENSFNSFNQSFYTVERTLKCN